MKENQIEQWEYTECYNPTIEELNQLGAKGWEAYAVIDLSRGFDERVTYYLKRKKGGAQ